jgi:hypothetical protein
MLSRQFQPYIPTRAAKVCPMDKLSCAADPLVAFDLLVCATSQTPQRDLWCLVACANKEDTMSENEHKRDLLTLAELDEAVGGRDMVMACFAIGDDAIVISATANEHKAFLVHYG